MTNSGFATFQGKTSSGVIHGRWNRGGANPLTWKAKRKNQATFANISFLVFFWISAVVEGITFSDSDSAPIPNCGKKSGKVGNFQRGKRCSLLMVNAKKWGAKINKWGRCQLAIA